MNPKNERNELLSLYNIKNYFYLDMQEQTVSSTGCTIFPTNQKVLRMLCQHPNGKKTFIFFVHNQIKGLSLGLVRILSSLIRLWKQFHVQFLIIIVTQCSTSTQIQSLESHQKTNPIFNLMIMTKFRCYHRFAAWLRPVATISFHHLMCFAGRKPRKLD